MSTTPTTLFVCPTTHIDWDWLSDFEQYYAIGNRYSTNAVRYTFEQMFEMLGTTSSPPFVFALAEMGYFRRYFVDTPGAATQVLAAGSALSLMGGGITSPDNLLSHGEAFIRNYLLGTQWLGSLGLESARAPVAWLPDDFGHDTQLPVVLAAMGMTAVGLSRVPGSPQGSPDVQPLDGSPNVATQLNQTAGLVFPWIAGDGSVVLCHFMPDTYSVDVDNLSGFVSSFSSSVWGSANMFAPVPSGDFATPTTDIINAVNSYNQNKVNGVTAQLGTFAQFVAAVLADTSGLSAPFTLRASNYWCGHFASRPQLKTDHYAAVRHLLATEVALGLVLAASTLARSVPDAMSRTLDAIWWSVAASTHHDFINGTAADQTYYLEQLPLSAQNRALAVSANERALMLLAASVAASASASETPFLVFNALGFARNALVSVANVDARYGSVRLAGSSAPVITQQGADGCLLFIATEVPSFGYTTAYLASGTSNNTPLPSSLNNLTFDNGVIRVVFAAASDGHSILSLFDQSTGKDLVSDTGLAGQLAVYNDEGNLYQFGNEPINNNGAATGIFVFNELIEQVESAKVLEFGPVRWRFAVTLVLTTPNTGAAQQRFEVLYTLVAGESFVRMAVKGRAPNSQSAVVVQNALVNAIKAKPTGLIHGTANHWDGEEPVPYWTGPTFQATHDFVLPSYFGEPFAAIYHSGMPAWCRDPDETQDEPNMILGTLFRSANGSQRGAAGTDADIHVQEFAIGAPAGANLAPASCAALKNATSFASALQVQEIEISAVGDSPTLRQTMPDQLSLAGITEGSGILRAARPQAGSGDVPAPDNDQSSQSPFGLVLRVYTPTNQPGTQLTLQTPAFQTPTPAKAALVTALELPLSQPAFGQPMTSITPDGTNSFVITAGTALTSVQIVGMRPYVQPSNGK
jgi:alpha-mannosidase